VVRAHPTVPPQLIAPLFPASYCSPKRLRLMPTLFGKYCLVDAPIWSSSPKSLSPAVLSTTECNGRNLLPTCAIPGQ
jgi:hypothetical protein